MRPYNGSDRHFLQLRNRRSICAMVDATNDAVIFIAGSGTRQGDTPSAQEFAVTFQSIVRKFDHRWYTPLETSYFVARHPCRPNFVYMGSSTWSDDLLKWKILPNDGKEKRNLQDIVDDFRGFLAPHGLDLNVSKTQVLCCFSGHGVYCS